MAKVRYQIILLIFFLSPVAGATEMLPYGVPFDSRSFLYLTPSHFLTSNSSFKSAFFSPSIFYPPLLELLKCSPMGSHLILFLFYILPHLIFLISNSLWSIGLFFARDFLSPVAGANVMLPDGVAFDSLSFLYVTPPRFFDLKFLMEYRPFFRPRFFILTDGMDGMGWMGWDGMDGLVRTCFCFTYFSKTT